MNIEKRTYILKLGSKNKWGPGVQKDALITESSLYSFEYSVVILMINLSTAPTHT